MLARALALEHNLSEVAGKQRREGNRIQPVVVFVVQLATYFSLRQIAEGLANQAKTSVLRSVSCVVISAAKTQRPKRYIIYAEFHVLLFDGQVPPSFQTVRIFMLAMTTSS